MKQKCTPNKFFTLVLSLCIGTTTVNAQWTPIKSLGVGPTDGCFSFNLHGKGYVGGGSNGSKFYQYDSSANTWALKGNAPGNKIRGFGYSFVINGKGYAGSGDTTGSNNPTADLWMYNDTTNTWTQKANFPGGGRDAMLCFVINDTAYIGGGFDAGGGGWTDFYKYDPVADKWTALSSLSMGVVGFPVSFVVNNKGYFATGQVGATESNGLWQYNPATDIWTAKTSLPSVARQAAFGFVIGDYAYVGGGMAGYDTVFYDMWRYNPFTDSWTNVQSLPSLYPAWSTAFTIGNTAFVGTGTYFNNTLGTLVSLDSFRKYWGVPNPALSVSQEKSTKHFELYPNPANDYLTITGDMEPGTIISISDLAGRKLKIVTGSANSLYIGDLQPGIYLVMAVNGSDEFTGKFVKE